MAMGLVWTLMVTAALVCGAVQGMLPAVTAAAMKGASAAVDLTLSMAGALCLWSGVMTVMERGGLTLGLARLFRPLLRRILPRASRDADTLAAVSANVSANLLGLGNAATPFALRAMERLQKQNPTPGVATPDMITLAVLNTASVNLIPTTLLTMRRAAGSPDPYRVIPVIWITSFSCAAFALLLCRAMGSACRRTGKAKGRASPPHTSRHKQSKQAPAGRRA